ncbi:MAG: phenylacetate--CoA ligase family protein [Actinomycetia bacterium]|nr:phenylacetate--CoA ligase family protein [Actinomycetes bacterium]
MNQPSPQLSGAMARARAVAGAKTRRAREIRYRRSVHAAYRHFLDSFPWNDSDAAQRLRVNALRDLCVGAIDGSPYQRQRFADAGLDPATISSVDDLHTLAPVTKIELRAAGNTATDPTRMGSNPLWWGTSGTSGEPFRFCMDHDYGIRTEALRGFLYHRFGHRRGPVVESMAGSGVPSGRDRSVPGYARHLVVWGDPINTQLDAIATIEPTAIYGNRSVLLQLVNEFEDRGAVPAIGLVVSSSETLWPADRIRLARSFGARVHDLYGIAEATAVCLEESPSGGYRVVEPRVIMEILDDQGRPVAPGDVGDIVVTNLDNAALPFIRYATGDRARLGKVSQPSGHAGMRIASIEGREADQVADHGGRPVQFWSLATPAFWAQPPIADQISRWQIIELAPGEFMVRLEPTVSGLGDSATDTVRAFLADRLGPVDITIEAGGVELEANGKFRAVKSSVDRS